MYRCFQASIIPKSKEQTNTHARLQWIDSKVYQLQERNASLWYKVHKPWKHCAISKMSTWSSTIQNRQFSKIERVVHAKVSGERRTGRDRAQLNTGFLWSREWWTYSGVSFDWRHNMENRLKNYMEIFLWCINCIIKANNSHSHQNSQKYRHRGDLPWQYMKKLQGWWDGPYHTSQNPWKGGRRDSPLQSVLHMRTVLMTHTHTENTYHLKEEANVAHNHKLLVLRLRREHFHPKAGQAVVFTLSICVQHSADKFNWCNKSGNGT